MRRAERGALLSRAGTERGPLSGAGTILVVEADESEREDLAALLERAGATSVAASDGRDGLRRFYEDRPDLVLLDVALPEIDGWEVLKRIREVSETPVLIVTASDQELEKVRGLRDEGLL